MNKKILAWILKAPLILVGIAAVPAAIYAGYAGLVKGYGSAVIAFVIIAAYVAGEIIARKERRKFY